MLDPLVCFLILVIKGTGKSGQNRDFDHFSRPLFISLVEFIKGTGKSGQNRDFDHFSRPLFISLVPLNKSCFYVCWGP